MRYNSISLAATATFFTTLHLPLSIHAAATPAPIQATIYRPEINPDPIKCTNYGACACYDDNLQISRDDSEKCCKPNCIGFKNTACKLYDGEDFCGSSSLLLNPAGFGGCCPTGRWKCFSPDAYYADPVEKPPEEVGNTNLKEGLKAHGCKEFEYEGGSEGSGE